MLIRINAEKAAAAHTERRNRCEHDQYADSHFQRNVYEEGNFMAQQASKEGSVIPKGQEVRKSAPAQGLSPFAEMNRMFEGFFPRGWMSPFRWEYPSWAEFEANVPRVDVIDHDDSIVVRAEVPGVDKKDLDISVSDNSVTLRGSSRREEKEEKDDYYRSEISRGAFSRTLMLPSDVDGSKAKASFKDGVLELVMPKVEKSKRHSIKLD